MNRITTCEEVAGSVCDGGYIKTLCSAIIIGAFIVILAGCGMGMGQAWARKL